MKSNKKEFLIKIRVTEEEKKQVIELQKSKKFDSVSSFLRYQVFQKQSDDFSENENNRSNSKLQISDLLQAEIGRIGRNINQVVKKANSTHGTSDLKILLEEIIFWQKEICDFIAITNQNITEYLSKTK